MNAQAKLKTFELTFRLIKPRPRASPSYKIADCELSNSYLLTRKIFSSNRQSYNLVNSVGLYFFVNNNYPIWMFYLTQIQYRFI